MPYWEHSTFDSIFTPTLKTKKNLYSEHKHYLYNNLTEIKFYKRESKSNAFFLNT